MKKTMLLTGLALAAGLSAQAQTTIAVWTFESSGLGSSTPSESPGAGVASTNFYAEGGAEAGTAAAFGLHAGAAVYTSPAGNGSAKSLSSTLWAVGDYYQYQISTTGYNNDITLSWAQTSSGTGPGLFQLEYSLTGSPGSFVNIGSAYTVLDNGLAPNASWTAGTAVPAYDFSVDLSGLTTSAINNQATVYLRFADASTTSSSGGTVGTGGTDRMDNVLIQDTAVPEPSSVALFGMGGATCLAFLRRFKK